MRDHEINLLPAVGVADELSRALSAHGTAILSAPPGSGKTTGLPLKLLDADWLAGRRIVVLEPRRLAARLAAERMAWLLGESVGQTVGYQVRGQRCIGKSTRIEVLTEGLLSRRLQADPELPGVGLVVFDEFHERSLQVDLALALALDARSLLAPGLRIAVMSATLDLPSLAAMLGDPPQIRADGRMFPVAVEQLSGGRAADVAESVVRGVRHALAAGPVSGDILAFLPGAAEIDRAARALENTPGLVVHCLHSSLGTAAQDAAVVADPAGRRKLILATNIAQTSITIDGVSVVVDGGFVRQARFDLGASADRLETVRISRATAEQRAGRAGRQGPGHAYRMWNAETQARLSDHDEPDILRSDLSRFALELAAWGTPLAELALIDAPPSSNWNAAHQLLSGIAALDGMNISAHGRRLLELPLAPRLAQLMLSAQAMGLSETGAWLAAVLDASQRPRSWNLMDCVSEARRNRRGEVAQTAARLQRLAGDAGRWQADALAAIVASAYPERIAQRRSGRDGVYATADGGEALLSGQSQNPPEWLAIAHWAPGKSRSVRMAAELDPRVFDEALSDRCQNRTSVRWDHERNRVVGRRGRFVGALELDVRDADPGDEMALAMLVTQAQRRGPSSLRWTEAEAQFSARVESLRLWTKDSRWPTMSAQAMLERMPQWLPAWGAGLRALSQLLQLDMLAVMRAELGFANCESLDRLAPVSLPVPSGSRIRLEYQADGRPPVLAVRLQEMFGAVGTPTVNDGQMPVAVHLLSPARRPIQVTQDLAGFWKGSYFDVRKDMRGRYPKHVWPEDPLNEAPTRRAKPGTRRR